MFHAPMSCPWQCHEIGGPWIAENPSCPFHGSDPLPQGEDGAFDIDPEDGARMCFEEIERQERERSEEEEDT